MQRPMFWAHSGARAELNSGGWADWQPLSQHLEAVAELAGKLAKQARPGDEQFARDTELAGLLHDYGKYSDCFQSMLLTGKGKCQHAIHGAMLTAGDGHPLHPHIALAIAGHHAGIPDYSGSARSMAEKLKEVRFQREAKSLVSRAVADSDRLGHALGQLAGGVQRSTNIPAAERDLYIRMLFSCLVDADRLDTGGRCPEQANLDATSRLEALLQHLNEISASCPEGVVKSMRQRVLEDCLRAADSPGNLFSLSVPTGGGKTLAAMAFALKRAAIHPDRFRRIIVVIPYLSIIEQNARVYTSVFGNDAVLEHHSGSVLPLREKRGASDEEDFFVPGPEDHEDERFQLTGLRPETENWDAPLIVTTSTRFFESLFSNRPKDLRRAHNIARSIVIFDEVQTLPRRLLSPLLKIQEELATHWGVNFVFATATQPAFERKGELQQDYLLPAGTMREIVRDPAPLRKALVRAQIDWQLQTPLSWTAVAEGAIDREQCLVIVNLRDHAAELYAAMLQKAKDNGESEDGIFHLSTRMCAAHRLRVLDRIRERLEANEPCRVVATQLIEAGVDVDFPLVMRAVGPLDSIIQAAGRADREGRLTARLGRPAGQVIVFSPEDNRMPPHEYKEAAAITEFLAQQALLDGGSIQVDSADYMQAYFARYYNPGDTRTLGSALSGLRHELKFAELAEQFEYINSRTKDVFVPDDLEARAALEQLRRIGQLTGPLRRKLQRHVVGLNPTEFNKARNNVIAELRPESDIWIAVDQAYIDQLGLLFELPVENLVL